MIDLFTLALTHGLIALALWRMLFRPDLDAEQAETRAPRQAWRKAAPGIADEGPTGD